VSMLSRLFAKGLQAFGGATVDASQAPVPSSGQVLTATSPSAATWQTPATTVLRNSYLTTSGVASGDPVYIATNDHVEKARADTDTSGLGGALVIGLNGAGAVGAGGTVPVCSAGPNLGILVLAVAGTAYFLQPTGGIGTAVPATGRIIQVGVAINATDLFVRILDMGSKL